MLVMDQFESTLISSLAEQLQPLTRFSRRLKKYPEDFIVDERLSYRAGDSTWLRLEKRACSHAKMQQTLLELTQSPASAMGYCGIKDKYALTRQWVSLSIESAKQVPLGIDLLKYSDEPGQWLRCVEKRSGPQLVLGVHEANHFTLRFKATASERAHLSSLYLQQERSNKPIFVANYFGPQRFGGNFSNLRGISQVLLEKRPARREEIRRISSALQSALFNLWLQRRKAKETWVLEGDWLEGLMGLNTTATDSINYLQAGDRIKLLGLLFGKKSRLPQGQAKHEFMELVEGLGLSIELLRECIEARGTLRRAQVEVSSFRFSDEPKTVNGEDCNNDADICVEFALPSGSFATAALPQLCGALV